jgi:hypothetical protein
MRLRTSDLGRLGWWPPKTRLIPDWCGLHRSSWGRSRRTKVVRIGLTSLANAGRVTLLADDGRAVPSSMGSESSISGV